MDWFINNSLVITTVFSALLLLLELLDQSKTVKWIRVVAIGIFLSFSVISIFQSDEKQSEQYSSTINSVKATIKKLENVQDTLSFLGKNLNYQDSLLNENENRLLHPLLPLHFSMALSFKADTNFIIDLFRINWEDILCKIGATNLDSVGNLKTTTITNLQEFKHFVEEHVTNDDELAVEGEINSYFKFTFNFFNKLKKSGLMIFTDIGQLDDNSVLIIDYKNNIVYLYLIFDHNINYRIIGNPFDDIPALKDLMQMKLFLQDNQTDFSKTFQPVQIIFTPANSFGKSLFISDNHMIKANSYWTYSISSKDFYASASEYSKRNPSPKEKISTSYQSIKEFLQNQNFKKHYCSDTFPTEPMNIFKRKWK